MGLDGVCWQLGEFSPGACNIDSMAEAAMMQLGAASSLQYHSRTKSPFDTMHGRGDLIVRNLSVL